MSLEVGQKIRAVYRDGGQQQDLIGYVTEILTNGSFTVSAHPPGEGWWTKHELSLYLGDREN